MKCKNCSRVVESVFCRFCGQNIKVKRLSTLVVIQDFLKSVADLDKGVLKTIVDLSQYPGTMIKKYLGGQRVSYFSAGKYTLLMVVLFTLSLTFVENYFGVFKSVVSMVDTLENSLVSKTKLGNKVVSDKKASLIFPRKREGSKNDSQANLKAGSKNLKLTGEQKTPEEDLIDININGFSKKVAKYQLVAYIKSTIPIYHRLFFDYLKVFSVLWIPLFALISWIFFRSSKLNFAEHLTFNSFFYAHMLLIFVLMSPLFWIFPLHSIETFFVIGIAMFFYLGFSYMQVFSDQSRCLVRTGAALSVGFFTFFVSQLTLLTSLAIYILVQNLHKIDNFL